MGAAQREVLPGDEAVETAAEEFVLTAPTLRDGAELKRQVAERLAAHRRRRGQSAEEPAPAPERKGRQNAIAAAVAERYAQTPSYRAFLAEQAQRAAEEAAAKAEVAKRNAQAAAAVQQELLMELERWEAPQEFTAKTAGVVDGGEAEADSSPFDKLRVQSDNQEVRRAEKQEVAAGGLTIRLYEDLGPATTRPEAARPRVPRETVDAAEALALDAEIAFRKSPVFEDYKAFLARDTEPPIPLPANLLEFPRQLVAARRARPRLAEGPLREEAAGKQQLRIFEVEAEQISTAPVVEPAAEYAAIRLGAHTMTAPVAGPQMPVMAAPLPPQTAPLRLRVMAGLVDLGLVLLALVGFVAVFAKIAGAVPAGATAWIALGATAVALGLAYQGMFFTLSDQTPGMRYARIGLCTFSDDNPTRAAMRRRILAQAMAVLPLGLGLLWLLLDDDGLGWHDRLSRMYQRAY